MTKRNPPLTAANVRYLLAIEELDPSGTGVRCVQVAQALGITKPSVHSMVDTMKERKLVEKSHYGVIHLTERGKELAGRYREYFSTIFRHFSPLLPEEQDAVSAAYVLLAELPLGSIDTMCLRLRAGAQCDSEGRGGVLCQIPHQASL